MWIYNTNTATRRLFNDDIMDNPVEFNDTGTAQVPENVAAAMCDHYETIQRKE
jgi:hypothetical protein